MAARSGVAFADLPRADLVVDRSYHAGTSGHAGDDPLARLLPVATREGSGTAAACEMARYAWWSCTQAAVSRTGQIIWIRTQVCSLTSVITGEWDESCTTHSG